MNKIFRNSAKMGVFCSSVFFLFLAIIPAFTRTPYFLHVLILCMIYSCLVLAWNLISGYAGIFSFGFQALFGLGGYVSAILCIRSGISPWIGIFVGALVSMSIGAVVAIPSLMLRQMPYIAISTMCLGEVIRIIAANLVDLTRGEMGLWGIPAFNRIGPIVFSSVNRIGYYYFIMIVLAIVMFVVAKIVRSPLGISLNAIKDSQDAAESLGVNVPYTKIKIYMISSFIAGIVGGFYAHYVLILTPTAVLGPQFMTEMVAMSLIGGLGTITGPVMGAFILTLTMESLRFLGNYRLVIYGAIIIVVIIFMRAGIWGTVKPFVTKKWDKRYKPAKDLR
jgi:branched-chain amino acid transport system permease protein